MNEESKNTDNEIDDMMREIDDLEGAVRWSSASMLAGIATAQFQSFAARVEGAERLRVSPDHTENTEDTEDDCRVCCQIDELLSEALDHGIVVIAFCAFAIEAHINDYGSRRLGASYFERFIDKLDTISKWVVIPRLVCGQEIDRGSQAFNLIVELFRFRNRIVHPKTRGVDLKAFAENEPFGISDHNLLFDFVPRAVESLKVVSEEARRLDPSDRYFGRLLR